MVEQVKLDNQASRFNRMERNGNNSSLDASERPANLYLNPGASYDDSSALSTTNDGSSSSGSQKSGDSDAASSQRSINSPAPQLARCYSQSQAESGNQTNGYATSQKIVASDADVQERIDLLEREKKVLQYHNQFLKEELESHKKQIAELHSTVADLRKRNIRYQNILTSYEQITAAGFNNVDKGKNNGLFQNQSQSLTSDDDNLSEKAVTPTSSTGTESDSTKSIPHQMNPNMQMSFSNKNPQTAGWEYKPPEFSFSMTERSMPLERPSHVRQRSLQYCHSASPLATNNLSRGPVRPSSPIVGDVPSCMEGMEPGQFDPRVKEAFRTVPQAQNLGNARMNSMVQPQQVQSASGVATTGSRASSCNERKVAPGPPPRTSALSKLENKNDKSNSVPNLNVCVSLEQKQMQSSNQFNDSDIPKPAPLKRNNSLIRLFTRKNSSAGTLRRGDPGSPMKKLSGHGSLSRASTLGSSHSENSTPNLNSRHNSISSQNGSAIDMYPGIPFQSWDRMMVASWLERLGLTQYIGSIPANLTGSTLTSAGPHHFEKLLGMKNHLHRKKLILAIRSQLSSRPNPVDQIDHNWVIRWLDDIGLPQHKEAFSEAKIDGRVLYYLTFDDLISLKVFSAIHQISIGRAVQCLRTQQWNPHCLIRRPHPVSTPALSHQSSVDEGLVMEVSQGQPQIQGPSSSCSSGGSRAPEDLLLWTNHRIMDWLRTIDLSEYAPNMRGSGIHGALMSLEPRFVGETLADVLCIPNSKTLLRRHLIAQFNLLVGPQCEELKRMVELSGHFQLLSPNMKVKCARRTRRRSRDRGGALNDLVCPLEFEVPNFISPNILPAGYFIRCEDFTNIPMSPSVFLEPHRSPSRNPNSLGSGQSTAGSLEDLVACGVFSPEDAFTAESVQDISMLSNQIQSLTTQLSRDQDQ